MIGHRHVAVFCKNVPNGKLYRHVYRSLSDGQHKVFTSVTAGKDRPRNPSEFTARTYEECFTYYQQRGYSLVATNK